MLMRVLLIAPDNADLAAYPEIRDITSLSHIQVQVLNGPVTLRDIYDAVRHGNFDVIHFAAHSNSEYLQLSNGERLYARDELQIAKMADVDLVFFNTCDSARHAAMLVRNGVPYAIATTVELPDKDAWKMPLSFYTYLNDQVTVDFAAAFEAAISGDGTYILTAGGLALANVKEISVQLKRMGLDIIALDKRITKQTYWLYIMVAIGALSWLTFGVFIW